MTEVAIADTSWCVLTALTDFCSEAHRSIPHKHLMAAEASRGLLATYQCYTSENSFISSRLAQFSFSLDGGQHNKQSSAVGYMTTGVDKLPLGRGEYIASIDSRGGPFGHLPPEIRPEGLK